MSIKTRSVVGCDNMGHMGEELEKKYYDELPLNNIKRNIKKMQREYIKERDKNHTQDEIGELTARIDILTQVLKLFPK